MKDAVLETVCGITSSFPVNRLPEIAFAGKSNVGKSSLINTLTEKKALARTSSKPGKTQTVNYYRINDSYYFVDLPGYGYATASPEAKAEWGKMIERYLHSSRSLKAVFLLVDIRHDPTDNDRMMLSWIRDRKLPFLVIATKLDKIKRSQIRVCIGKTAEGLGVDNIQDIIPFSAETGQGKNEIFSRIGKMILT